MTAVEHLGNFHMTPEQVRAIAREASAEAVKETLLRLGLAADDPLNMQRDMQHLRDWRRATESIKTKGMLTLVGLAISGFVALLILGLKAIFGR